MMTEQTPLFFDGQRFVITSRGNKISRQVLLRGSDKISIEGKTIIQSSSVLRGDLAHIKIGMYVIIREDVIVRPCHMK